MLEFLVVIPRNELPEFSGKVLTFNDFETAVRNLDDVLAFNAELWMFDAEYGSWERLEFIRNHKHVSQQIKIG